MVGRLHAGGAVALALAVGWAGGAGGQQRGWTVELEPVLLQTLGNEPHVLTRGAATGAPPSAREEAVHLDADEALGYRAVILYDRGALGYGLDFLIYRTDQRIDPQVAAGGGGVESSFEVAGRRFVSNDPGEALYFQALEDTTTELWVLDLYLRRALAESAGGTLDVVLGLRNADFDNDVRAVAGSDPAGGVRIDASSNYGRMLGPLVGLAARLERGRHTLRGDLRQSAVLGEVELTRTLRDFTGPPGPFAGPPEEVPAGIAQERLTTTRDIAVPMTDVRLAWSVRLTRRLSLGASLGATAWWDLAVPPGVEPGPGGEDRLRETTLVTYGLGASLGWAF
jgi:hypothetical protein